MTLKAAFKTGAMAQRVTCLPDEHVLGTEVTSSVPSTCIKARPGGGLSLSALRRGQVDP